jgi:septal ring factor EnvC (AmiA/AmiB activator)
MVKSKMLKCGNCGSSNVLSDNIFTLDLICLDCRKHGLAIITKDSETLTNEEFRNRLEQIQKRLQQELKHQEKISAQIHDKLTKIKQALSKTEGKISP